MAYTRAVSIAATDAELSSASHIQLSNNFTLAEFYVHEKPPADVEGDKLPRIVTLCQWFRTEIARGPVDVTSYFRSLAHNTSVDGANASAHMTGDGVDLTPDPAVDFATLAQRVTAAIAAGTAPAFGSMIFYADEGHVHLTLDRIPNNDHFTLFFSPMREDGAARSYLSFVSFAQFQKLVSSHGGALLALLIVVCALAFIFRGDWI